MGGTTFALRFIMASISRRSLRLNSDRSNTLSIKLDGVEYDCDVAVLWDRQLMIFECKNYSLPNDEPEERFYF